MPTSKIEIRIPPTIVQMPLLNETIQILFDKINLVLDPFYLHVVENGT